MTIEPGIVNEIHYTVSERDTASASAGEQLPPVFSTPRMIDLMETVAEESVAGLLDAGQTTVGVLVNVRHLAATPVGMPVRLRAELLEVDGSRLRFRVEAWDAVEKIGEGEHERFIINRQRFMQRVEGKKKMVSSHPSG